jgi:hypothetical protein
MKPTHQSSEHANRHFEHLHATVLVEVDELDDFSHAVLESFPVSQDLQWSNKQKSVKMVGRSAEKATEVLTANASNESTSVSA